jgi:hypothetical protein
MLQTSVISSGTAPIFIKPPRASDSVCNPLIFGPVRPFSTASDLSQTSRQDSPARTVADAMLQISVAQHHGRRFPVDIPFFPQECAGLPRLSRTNEKLQEPCGSGGES